MRAAFLASSERPKGSMVTAVQAALKLVASWAARRTTRSETSSAPTQASSRSEAAQGPSIAFCAQIVDHLVVDPVGGPAKRQFPQRRQVARGEEILRRAARRLGHIDLAFVQALDQLLRRDVDENDVGRLLQDTVGHGLAHDDA